MRINKIKIQKFKARIGVGLSGQVSSPVISTYPSPGFSFLGYIPILELQDV